MQPPLSRGFAAFVVIWLGEVASRFGIGVSGFALGVWVYQRTGSATKFALIQLFTTLPSIVLSPLAGVAVDRWDRRRVMLLANAGGGLAMLAPALLLMGQRLQVWQIYVTMAVGSCFSSLQWPAFSATTPLLVPKKHLGRAAGMVQLGEAAAQIGAPVLAASLMLLIEIYALLLMDCATFGLAIITLLLVRIPRPAATGADEGARGSLFRDATFGWSFIKARPGLLGLLALLSLSNFATGVFLVLFTPMVLTSHSPLTLGTLLTVGGVGMLAGSLLMIVWGGPKRRVYGSLVGTALMGICIGAAGLPVPVWALGAGAFIGFGCLPVASGCNQAIWQTKTAPDIQGRVFAVRRMLAWLFLPLAYVVAGPLADRVFEPLMVKGGPLADSLGRVFGVGPGRGMGLIIAICGGLMLLLALASTFSRRIRRVEAELPDMIGDDPADSRG